jgi:uncharacterized repeat protein (TIGR03803 family)
MKANTTGLRLWYALSLIAIATLCLTVAAAAQTEKFLHSFNNNGTDGYGPYYGGLVSDASGNLYGTTALGGGDIQAGTVFELSHRAAGWSERVLYSFSGADGRNPEGALTFDAAGNLYGTTAAGGANNNSGTVFELSPKAGAWMEKVLYNFGANSTDGQFLFGAVTLDSAGNVYGVTGNGGTYGHGTVFELSPLSSGTWTETILLNFEYSNGAYPQGTLIFDTTGNLYGTTAQGGLAGNGVVFELSPSSRGGWTETILYNFDSSQGPVFPAAGVIMDSAGNLYGTGSGGGAFNSGAAFKLSPSGGTWTETTMHSFNSRLGDGSFPRGLTMDSAGNFYGTTAEGGNTGCFSHGCGIVFKLTPSGNSWTETILHRFGNGTDGEDPRSSVVLDAAGNLYGTTVSGGAFGLGTAFEIVP